MHEEFWVTALEKWGYTPQPLGYSVPAWAKGWGSRPNCDNMPKSAKIEAIVNEAVNRSAVGPQNVECKQPQVSDDINKTRKDAEEWLKCSADSGKQAEKSYYAGQAAREQIKRECVQLADMAYKKYEACDKQAKAETDKTIDKMEKEKPIPPDLASGAAYSIKTIRMTGKNETTGAISCAADLHAVLPDGNGAKEPITYLIEKTLDTGELYVTVHGLQ